MRDDDDQWEHIGKVSMDAVNAAQRIQLAMQIRKTLNETLPTPEARAKWLQVEAQMILREAERAKRPLETFPADPIAEAF